MTELTLKINGEDVTANVEPRLSLADFIRDHRIDLSIPDPSALSDWDVSDYFLNYAAFLFSGILLALPRGGEFLYALLSLTGTSLDAAWQSGRKARKLLGPGRYFQLLGFLLVIPVGLGILEHLLELGWLRYLVIAWYPFGASLLYCYFREVYMGRTENSVEAVKASATNPRQTPRPVLEPHRSYYGYTPAMTSAQRSSESSWP